MAERIKPVEMYILSGLQRRIQEVFGLATDFKLTIDPTLQATGVRKDSYPYPYLRLNSIEHRNEETNAVRGLEKRWTYGGSTSDNNGVRAYRFLNVMFDIGFHVVSNNYEHITSIMNAWMFAYRFNSLNFRIVYDNIGIDIKVILTDNVQVPWMDEGLDERVEFEFEGNIQVWGYMSQMVERTQDVIKSVSLQFGLEGSPTPEYSVDIDWDDPFAPKDKQFAVTNPVITTSSIDMPENQTAWSTIGVIAGTSTAKFADFRFMPDYTRVSADGLFQVTPDGRVLITKAGSEHPLNNYESGIRTAQYTVVAMDASDRWADQKAITINVLDVPEDAIPPVITNTDSANFGWKNPVQTGLAVSSDRMSWTIVSSGGSGNSRSSETVSAISEKSYCEFTVVSSNPSNYPTGVGISSAHDVGPFSAGFYGMFRGNGGCGLAAVGLAANGGIGSDARFNFSVGDRLMVAFDPVNHLVWFGKNGSWVAGDPAAGTGGVSVAPATYFFSVSSYSCFIPSGSMQVDVYPTTVLQLYSAPVGFKPYQDDFQTFQYLENLPAGTVIGTVQATDNIGVTQFRFADTGTNVSPDGYFQISAGGIITMTTAGSLGPRNNFEAVSPAKISYAVQAGDLQDNWSLTRNVSLTVVDILE